MSPFTDHLLEFSEKDSYIQNYCCSVLEQYWLQDLPDKDFLAVYVPAYLLARMGCSMGKVGLLIISNEVPTESTCYCASKMCE